MQSCSVHHCVLFLLTLTFTTDPASAAVCPVYATLHQPVTLPCESYCDGVAEWNLNSNRDVVFAECNETSCRSLKDGYEMSHTRYLRGDFSLTITKPDYSMRETYACECGSSDYATVRLRISTVSSAVQVKTEGDLKMNVSVPEPVEVIYKSRDSAAGEQICNVTQRSLQCKAEYTPRTSLSYPELTLRGLGRSEGGTYTIRNLDYKEEIRVYAVSVSGLYTWETVMIVIGVVLLLAALIPGVMMYQKRGKVKRQKVEVEDLIQQYESKPPGEEKEKLLQQAEEMIDALWQQYKKDREYIDDIALFCMAKRDQLVKRQKEEVKDLMHQSVYKPPGEQRKKLLKQVEEKIDALWEKYKNNKGYEHSVGLFCDTKRIELKRIEQGDIVYFKGKLMTRTEVVVSILQELESQVSEGPITDQQRSEMCKHAESHLQRIRLWCSEQDTMIKKFRDQPSGDVTNAEKIHNKETHVNEVEKRDKEKNDVLERSRENIKPAGETDPLINVGLSAVPFVKSPKHSLDATFSPDSGIEMAQYQPDLNVVDVI